MYRVRNFISEYSILLIAGALAGLLWANLNPHGYHHFVEYPVLFNDYVGLPYEYWTKKFGEGYDHFHPDGATHVLSLHYLVNDILMAFFFAVAAKEVWEAVILKDGSLRGKKAATPLFATVGGMAGPIAVYLGLALFLGSDVYDAVNRGWAIPTATDIAFSYLVGRLVFGAGHPAVRFLMLLAIADDAAGLVILAIFYPSGELAPVWLLMSVAASAVVYILFNRLPRMMDKGKELRPNSTWVRKYLSFWPYLIAGVVSWYGFYLSGLHTSLGLLPIVVAIPHADRAFGIFAAAETHMSDLLNTIEHGLKYPVEVILLFFGLLNAGVEFSSISEATWLVLAGLLIGKPVGVLIFGVIGAHILRFGLPEGMRTIDMFVIGCVSAIGFTVSLFVASVAFETGPVQDAAKMGALLSFAAVIVSFVAGYLCKVEKKHL